MDALTTFSRAVNEATSLLGESGFAEALSNGMRELIEADDVSLIRYPDAGPPVIEYNLPPKRRGKTTLDRYEALKKASTFGPGTTNVASEMNVGC